MKTKLLKELSAIQISNVDKKTKENEISVKLCNYTDVYYNWSIYNSMISEFMDATAKVTEINKFSLKKNDVVITKDSETKNDIGKSAIIIDELSNCLLGYHCALIRPNINELDGAYLNAVLNTEFAKKYFELNAGGSGQRFYLNIDVLENMPIPILPIKKQEEIGCLFNNIDKKIYFNNKINDNLSKQLQTIYNYWFNQFEFPNKNGKPYKSSGGKLTYNKLLNQNIPIDFTIEPITNHIDWISGSQPPKSQFVYEMKNGYVRFIQNRDYSSNSHLTYIPISKNNKLCTEYDIMIDKYGEAGKTRFGIAGAYNVALSKVSVKSQIMQEYIRAYLSSDAIKNYLSNSCLASTRASLNESIVSNLYLLIPNKETLIQFEKIGKLMVGSIIKNNREIEHLISIRDYLLPLLINGQATIS